MEGKGGGQQRKKSDLHHGIVEHRSLSLSSRCVAVLELATNSAVTSGDCHTAGKDAASLHDNG